MKKLAIIGGSYLQLPLVKKAIEMGIEVHCFSWEDGSVCKEYSHYFYPVSIIEKEQILEICRKLAIDGILTISSDIAVITVNYVASALGLVSNPDKYSKITTNKFLMRECFLQNNIPSPLYTRTKVNEQINLDAFHFPLIVKPTDRSGSRGVEKIYCLEELSGAIEYACQESFSKEAIIEEFVEGEEISVESISWKGVHYILALTDKITTNAPYFVELEHHQPSNLKTEVKEKIKDITLKALDALHIQYGASHSEFKITSSGDIKVIEIGARMGGDFIGSDLVYLSTGYDFLKGVIEIALNCFNTPQFFDENHSGVYFLCEETKGLLEIIKNASEYKEIVQAEITDSVLRNIKCSGDRSGFLIYQSNKKMHI